MLNLLASEKLDDEGSLVRVWVPEDGKPLENDRFTIFGKPINPKAHQ